MQAYRNLHTHTHTHTQISHGINGIRCTVTFASSHEYMGHHEGKAIETRKGIQSEKKYIRSRHIYI